MEAILLINNETLVCLFSEKIEELGCESSKCIEFGEKEKATVLGKYAYATLENREKQNVS